MKGSYWTRAADVVILLMRYACHVAVVILLMMKMYVYRAVAVVVVVSKTRRHVYHVAVVAPSRASREVFPIARPQCGSCSSNACHYCSRARSSHPRGTRSPSSVGHDKALEVMGGAWGTIRH